METILTGWPGLVKHITLKTGQRDSHSTSM